MVNRSDTNLDNERLGGKIITIRGIPIRVELYKINMVSDNDLKIYHIKAIASKITKNIKLEDLREGDIDYS